MTTELKQAAQQSTLCLQAVCRYISDVLAGDASSSEKHIARTIMHLLPLEQAVPIQQAEAKTDKPAAVRNPFASRCYTMSESHLSGHRLIVGFEKLGDAQDAHEWVARQGRGDFTHPAPSVPDDDLDLICNAIDKADTITMEGDYMLDSDDCIAVVRVMQVLLSVRAAMLAAN